MAGPVLEISLANKRRMDRRNTRPGLPLLRSAPVLSHLDGPRIIKRGGSNPRFKFRPGRAT